MQNQRPPEDGPAFRLGQAQARFGTSQPGPLGRLLGAIVWAGLLIIAFTFSLVFFAVVFSVGLLIWAYVWWKTRELRKQVREQMGAQMREQPPGGNVIEGEVVRDYDRQDKQRP